MYGGPKTDTVGYILLFDRNHHYIGLTVKGDNGYHRLSSGSKFNIGNFEFEGTNSKEMRGIEIGFGLAVELLNNLKKTNAFFADIGWSVLTEKFNKCMQITLNDFGCDEFEAVYKRYDKLQITLFK